MLRGRTVALLRRFRAEALLPTGAALLVMGCTGGSPAAPASPGVPVGVAPVPTLTAPIRRLRRLSNREYDNVVRDLFGDRSSRAANFVVDVYQNGYDNGSAGLAVQSDQVVGYQGAAEALAANAVQNNIGQVLGGCDPAASGDQACLEGVLSSFAPRAFRRSLTATESGRLRDVFQAELQSGGDFGRGIQTVLEVILQSPEFLYREELGPLDVKGASQSEIRLTDLEVASELSFLLTGSIPDAELWAAAQEGRLTTVYDYEREAARLLASQGAKDTFRAFLHEWLATDRLPTLSKDAQFYPSFNASMAASMAAELDLLFDGVLWSGTGSLRELFTTHQSFADPTLAQLYGVPVVDSGLLPVALDARVRQGILTRAGFLAVHSATDSSGPIERGVFLLRSIMCSPPPRPPANVPPAPPAGDPSVQNLTTRQRFEQHVSNPLCASCHTRIDGVGFGFEEFDGIGAYREVDNGQPVDSSGAVVGTGEIDGDFQGAAELAVKLSGSRVLANCYARQAYRYAMGAVEGPQDDLGWLTAASSADANMTAVLLAIVDSEVFVTRTFE
jgi:hypothetical protein